MGERGRHVRRAIDNNVDGAAAEMAMRRAIDLTRSTHPHPNPRVGAVILAPDGAMRSSGAHEGPGRPHAERVAIEKGCHPGDTLVVTLEPCDHHGRTPPCTEAIVRAGITKVVIGAVDPDPRVAGRGVDRLRAAGIDVEIGVLGSEVEGTDPGYFHHRRRGRARITLKLAATLDGQVAAIDGTSQWITGDAARRDAHRLRSEHDAVLVGIGTVVADDPDLTDRRPEHVGPQPRPVVVLGRRSLPASSTIGARDPLLYQSEDGVDLAAMAVDLPSHGILSVLVEGGPTLARSLLDAGVVDEIVWYVAGRLAGGTGLPAIGGTFATVSDAIPIDVTSVERIGEDLRLIARIGQG
jgi:diaminohydroxyphosphoribosylaminopyrimidine deaminase / 5-amino-6-(5-phosphoribosylamino)uracil reductase